MQKRLFMIIKRIEKGFSQKELAKKVGVSNQTISNIENGHRNPSGELSAKIADELEFDMALFFKDDEKNETA